MTLDAYLSTTINPGEARRWRVILGGAPLCADTDAPTAIGIFRRNFRDVSDPPVWDGDAGAFVTLSTWQIPDTDPIRVSGVTVSGPHWRSASQIGPGYRYWSVTAHEVGQLACCDTAAEAERIAAAYRDPNATHGSIRAARARA